jgi:hypothetical protein
MQDPKSSKFKFNFLKSKINTVYLPILNLLWIRIPKNFMKG